MSILCRICFREFGGKEKQCVSMNPIGMGNVHVRKFMIFSRKIRGRKDFLVRSYRCDIY